MTMYDDGAEEAHQFTMFDEEPTDEEIVLFAKMMGMHPIRDQKYLYLAREGMPSSNCRIDEPSRGRMAPCQGCR